MGGVGSGLTVSEGTVKALNEATSWVERFILEISKLLWLPFGEDRIAKDLSGSPKLSWLPLRSMDDSK